MWRITYILAFVAMLGACVDIPASSKRQPVRQSTATFSPSPSARQCLSDLGHTQARFTSLPDRYFSAGCSTLNAVRLSSVQADLHKLEIANLGPVTCPLAQTFAGWARYGVDRAARQILGSPLVEIETFGSYNCRTVAGSNRLSSHATADAIDVSGFVLADGRSISILDDWDGGTSAERKFLRIVHGSACKRFGVVLGPQYNSAHHDHFHLERKDSAFCR